MKIKIMILTMVFSILSCQISYADFSLEELKQIEIQEFEELLQAADSEIKNREFRKADDYVKIAFEKKHLSEDFKKSKLKPLVTNLINSQELLEEEIYKKQKKKQNLYIRLKQEEERIARKRSDDACKLPREPLTIDDWGEDDDYGIKKGKCIWEKRRILLSNGRIIYGRLDNDDNGCYRLSITGAYPIWAKNCSKDINGQWKVTICLEFDNSFHFIGDHTNVIEAAMKRLDDKQK